MYVKLLHVLWISCALIFIVCITGCVTAPPAPAPVPVTETVTAPPSPETGQLYTIALTAAPTKAVPAANRTPAIPADPTDVTKINFTRYADSDLAVKYPAAWSAKGEPFTTYMCTSTATLQVPNATRCYQHEIDTIGPFDFKSYGSMKNPAHLLTFTSADGKMRFVALISAFVDNVPGTSAVDPNLEWIAGQISTNFPDLGRSQVGDYRYTQVGSRIYSGYTMNAPNTSAAYPLSYTMNYYVTYRHFYRFAFIADPATLQRYTDLRAFMLSSVQLNDMA